jgi:hypothetical protein
LVNVHEPLQLTEGSPEDSTIDKSDRDCDELNEMRPELLAFANAASLKLSGTPASEDEGGGVTGGGGTGLLSIDVKMGASGIAALA